MISIDTDILVRIIVDDSGQSEQNIKARRVVVKHKTVFVSQIVQIETVLVLSRAYDFSRKEIGLILEKLLSNESFQLENENIFSLAFPLYCASDIDFSDAIILQTSIQKKLKLLSFDTKLQKQQIKQRKILQKKDVFQAKQKQKNLLLNFRIK